MDVSKVQRLSEQWKSLKAFYDSCCHQHANLSVAGPGVPDATLNQATTDSVVGDLRVASLRELGRLERNIKQETAR